MKRSIHRIDCRLQIMKIIDTETDTIKKATDRRNYWKKMLQRVESKDFEMRQLTFPIEMGGER